MNKLQACINFYKENIILANNRTKVLEFEKAKGKTIDDRIREHLFQLLEIKDPKNKVEFNSKILHRKEVIFEFLESIINSLNSVYTEMNPLLRDLVEVQRVDWNEDYKFKVPAQAAILRVSKFSGAHWDTDRQKLRGQQHISIPTEWNYVHVYAELWDFLVGNIKFEDFAYAIVRSYNWHDEQAIAKCFENSTNLLDAEYTYIGTYNKDLIMQKIALIETVTGGMPTILGTRTALAQLTDNLPIQYFSWKMADRLSETGELPPWFGYQLQVLPYTAIINADGRPELVDNSKKLWIIPKNIIDSKPIKKLVRGTSLIKETRQEQENQDMTLALQVQKSEGLGLILSDIFGYMELL